jgi:hypothetical protein
MIALAAAAITAVLTCPTPNPGAGFVCQNGQWLPPNHPLVTSAPPPSALPPQPPDMPPYGQRFRVGRRYQRGTTDVSIIGTAQLPDGVAVLVALCLQDGDGCYGPGYVRLFLYEAAASDWRDVTEP